jgi:hypothetical protein
VTSPEVPDVPPRFSFTQGRFSKSGLIVGLPDTHADHKKAVAMFVGLIPRYRRTRNPWQMEVLDETGKPVFRLRLLGESLE